ncbi:MAG TPA: HU family DNA-binding protein [Chitinophagaceae bacterium]|nr:HU family DNA-binding protein [Chitinophagaceae bacterium]
MEDSLKVFGNDTKGIIFAGIQYFIPHQKTKTFMNKAELIDKIAKDSGINKTQANDALDSFTKSVVDTLKKGGKVTLVGFGTFSVTKRSARKGRNPQTNKVINIPAKKVAKFKAGKEFSSRLK